MAIEYRYFGEPVPDFVALVRELDEGLWVLNGDLQAVYEQYNGLEGIEDIVLAYDGGRAVGCASLKKHGEAIFEVKRVFVDPGYRGRGIAGTMMRWLEEAALRKKASSLILETGRDFKPAVALYKGLGYEVIENYGQYAGMPQSLCMRKALRAAI